MSSPGVTFFKTFIKSSLDNYVLPGTLTGTEILLFYVNHWKHKLHIVASGALYLVSVEIEIYKLEKVAAQRSNEAGACGDPDHASSEPMSVL